MSTTLIPAPAQLDSPIALKIREAAPQFAPFLPASANVEQVVAAVYRECQRVPKILQCTPESVVSAACDLVQWGYDIGRTGFLVPFKGKCSPVPHYRGYIENITAAGAARSCDAREVREGDFFDFAYGTEGFIKHVPGGKDARTPGKLTHFYAIWYVGFGVSKWEVMTVAQVEAIHRNSAQWANTVLESIPWYGVKTVIRKSSKYFAQNPKLARFFNSIRQEEIAELGTAAAAAESKLDAPPALPAGDTQPAEGTVEFPGAMEEDSEDVSDVTPVPTLTSALGYILPGQPGSWGGYGGKPLGECRNSVLKSASAWCETQMAKDDSETRYLPAPVLKVNIDAVLAGRVAGLCAEPEKVKAA